MSKLHFRSMQLPSVWGELVNGPGADDAINNNTLVQPVNGAINNNTLVQHVNGAINNNTLVEPVNGVMVADNSNGANGDVVEDVTSKQSQQQQAADEVQPVEGVVGGVGGVGVGPGVVEQSTTSTQPTVNKQMPERHVDNIIISPEKDTMKEDMMDKSGSTEQMQISNHPSASQTIANGVQSNQTDNSSIVQSPTGGGVGESNYYNSTSSVNNILPLNIEPETTNVHANNELKEQGYKSSLKPSSLCACSPVSPSK